MPESRSIKPQIAQQRSTEQFSSNSLTGLECCFAAAVALLLLAVAAASQVIEAPPVVRDLAQFAHLACVVVGLGSVIVVDWFGLRWLLGHVPLETVVTTASALAVPIWFGFGGLLLSGMFLSPDLTSPLTWVKIGVVAVAGMAGVVALALRRRLSAPAPPPSTALLRGASAVAVMSQFGWWTASVIGFLNRS